MQKRPSDCRLRGRIDERLFTLLRPTAPADCHRRKLEGIARPCDKHPPCRHLPPDLGRPQGRRLDDSPSTCPHDRARWRHLSGRDSPTASVAIGTVRSARVQRGASGWPSARPSSSQCRTSTSCSRCRLKSGQRHVLAEELRLSGTMSGSKPFQADTREPARRERKLGRQATQRGVHSGDRRKSCAILRATLDRRHHLELFKTDMAGILSRCARVAGPRPPQNRSGTLNWPIFTGDDCCRHGYQDRLRSP